LCSKIEEQRGDFDGGDEILNDLPLRCPLMVP